MKSARIKHKETKNVIRYVTRGSYNCNDWDFEIIGRIRQANRMRCIADFEKQNGRIVICDFVCPTKETREKFDADIVIWMDTIGAGRFEDTNRLFQEPKKIDFHITEWNQTNHKTIAEKILQR